MRAYHIPQTRYALFGMFAQLMLAWPQQIHGQTPTADAFNPGAGERSIVYCLAVQADHRVLLGGSFTSVGGQSRNRIARVEPDGTLDRSFNPGSPQDVHALAVQADGKILVAAYYASSPNRVQYIRRLNADGTEDAGFTLAAEAQDWPIFSGAEVRCFAVQRDAKVLVAGGFVRLGGQPRNNVARLNPDGSIDLDFNPENLGYVSCLLAHDDGDVLMGTTSAVGNTVWGLNRVSRDGARDADFRPRTDNLVRAVVLQPDGRLLVAGEFTTLGGQARSRLGRLNADGSVDPSFNPGADATVHSLVLQTDGKVLVAGSFTNLGARNRSRIGRLHPDGSVDLEFNPGASRPVYALALQGDGKLLVGGEFSTLGGQNRSRLGRLNSSEPAVESLAHDGARITWHRGGSAPEVSHVVFEHSADGLNWNWLGAGTRIAGGWELAGIMVPEGGTVRGRARLAGGQSNGSTWFAEAYSGAPAWIKQPDSRRDDAGTTSSFSVMVGGDKPQSYQWQKDGVALTDGVGVAGATTASLTLSGVLKADAGAYAVVVSNQRGSVTSEPAMLSVTDPVITTQPVSLNRRVGQSAVLSVGAAGTGPLRYEWRREGVVLEGANGPSLIMNALQGAQAGVYSATVSNAHGDTATSAGAMLTVNVVTLESSFDPKPDSHVLACVVQADGRVLLGGSFRTLGSHPRKYLGRLNADGSVDTAFNPPAPDGLVRALAVQVDGRILVGGEFWELEGVSRSGLARLNADGTLDPTFGPETDDSVHALALQADGRILVAGRFGSLGVSSRSYLGRLNSDGTVDEGFDPRPDSPVYALAVQADGKVLVGGYFSKLCGQARRSLGRLNPDGTLDVGFDLGTDQSGTVFALAMQADGKILVGGEFSALGGEARENLGRLNADGGLDTGFNAGTDRSVRTLVVQADTCILVGGQFTALGGVARRGLGRLKADGGVDPQFNPGADSTVETLALQEDGRLLAGGAFGSLGGASRTYVGRLDNVGSATQVLRLDGSTVTWMRAGSSPEVWRTTFERSADGVLWTPLGEGSRVTGGWQLQGVALGPADAIRARGLTGSGWCVGVVLTLSQPSPPTITSQPAHQELTAGHFTTITVEAAGTEPLSYQWYEGASGDTDRPVPGATLAAFVTPSLETTALFWVRVSNIAGVVDSEAATITIRPVNDAPAFVKGAEQTVLEDAGPQTVPAWATGISAGPVDEAGQRLAFSVSADNPALFTAGPAVSPDGMLTYTPAPNANGMATVTIVLKDDGGTADGGADTSPPQTFTITVMPVNDAPAFVKGADQTVLEDAGLQTVPAWATGISAGPADEAGQGLAFAVSADNPALFSAGPAVSPDGTLAYTPAPNANGMATVTIVLKDDGGTADGGADTSAPQTFTITVQPPPPPLRIGGIAVSDGSIEFQWLTRSGKGYQVVWTEHLRDPEWAPWGAVIQGDGKPASVAIPVGQSAQIFYRVVELP